MKIAGKLVVAQTFPPVSKPPSKMDVVVPRLCVSTITYAPNRAYRRGNNESGRLSLVPPRQNMLRWLTVVEKRRAETFNDHVEFLIKRGLSDDIVKYVKAMPALP
jgi:hypothetical protein